MKDRHAWSASVERISEASKLLSKSKPLVLYSICVNTGVLYTIKEMMREHSLPLDIRSTVITPLDYLLNPEFPKQFDLCVTELSVPFRLDPLLGSEFRLLFPIHNVREALVSRSPFVSRVFTVRATSTESHFEMVKRRLGYPKKEALSKMEGWRTVLEALGEEEGILTWEPFLSGMETRLAEESGADGSSVTLGDRFPMGLFSSSKSWSDPVRRADLLAFCTLFISTWTKLFGQRSRLIMTHLNVLSEIPKWYEAFSQAAMLTSPGVEGETFNCMALKEEVKDALRAIWHNGCYFPGFMDSSWPIYKELNEWLAKRHDFDTLVNARRVVQEVLTDTKMPPTAMLTTMHRKLTTKINR